MEDGEIIELYWRRDRRLLPKARKNTARTAVPSLPDSAASRRWRNAWWTHGWRRGTLCRRSARRYCVPFWGGSAAICPSIARCMIKRASAAAGEVTAALEELREIGGGSAEEAVEQAELGRLIDRFLRTLPEKECSIFLRRYWFLDSVEEIARRYGLRGGSVKTRLHRTRKKLREYLKQEGYAL